MENGFRDRTDDGVVGLRDRGLLSPRVLAVGVPDRPDWDDATAEARGLLDAEGRNLVEKLGYEIERLDDRTHLLKDARDARTVSDARETSDARKVAVAVFLRNDESFDREGDRFTGAPISRALAAAEREGLDYVVASSGSTLRLYATDPDAGFGSGGRTGTFVEVTADRLAAENAGYLWLLFSADALREGGSLHEIATDSREYAAALGRRLRERIYDDVIPDLAGAIAEARDLDGPTKAELDETYRMSLVLLYRLLFVAYAEDEDLLPRHDPRYEERSLQSTVRELRNLVRNGGDFDAESTTHWDDVMGLFRAIHDGHSEWGLPEYNGRLLSSDPDISDAGAKLTDIQLTDDQFGPVLANLLIDEAEDGCEGPVDFRNIGIREFGVVYEGLLESELSVADRPLAVDADGRYVPADTGGRESLGGGDEDVVVEEGQIYLHGRSGERKATGSYYTETRFVAHLLDHSLEPALTEHTDRLDRLREVEGREAAADAFFDLRVADVSMGSGNFLVGAVDRIATRLTTYLDRDDVDLPEIDRELDRLREAAADAFETGESPPTIGRRQLLRRQVARRCVYGVDVDDHATELARLSLWVHTFVPGLPFTFFDYNLTIGDALSGIGTLDEVSEVLNEVGEVLNEVSEIEDAVDELGRRADADAAEVADPRETRAEIDDRLEATRAAFDVLAASRVDDGIDPTGIVEGDLLDSVAYSTAQDVLADADPVHFPAAFPEVFAGDDGGFDVIVGNPPWEEAMLQEEAFWMRYEPGLQGKSAAEQAEFVAELRATRPDLVAAFESEKREQERRRELLNAGPYPGMGTGNPDLYKAFCWRFWALVREGGRVGVVLPRNAFLSAGSEDFRREVLESGRFADVTFVTNRGQWAFPAVHPQFTIALTGFRKERPTADAAVPLRGPFPDEESFETGTNREPYRFPISEVEGWTDSASFPLLPSEPRSLDAFERMSAHPPLNDESGAWRAVPHRELDSSADRKRDDGTALMHFADSPPEGFWPVYKGGSFEHWNPDTGVRHSYADPDAMVDYLHERRENSYRYVGSRSAFSEMSEEWVCDESTLPCFEPRVAIRGVGRATDRRTIIPALVPPETFLTSRVTHFNWPRGDERDEAYLLGVLSSVPLDWYARRFVEANVNYFILNAFPIPRPGRGNALRERAVELSGRLAAVDDRYGDWADAVGVDWGPLDEDGKRKRIYELDAVVAHLYGLGREHLEVVFGTFHDTWDHEPRLRTVLEYYDEWAAKLA